MKRTRSITVRLALVFVTLLLCVILLGGLSIGSLSYFNGVSSQVRDRWLPSTGALGDLNNLTSDFRAAEAARLLAQSESDVAASEHEMQELDRGIALARNSYTRIRHDATEDALYARFASDWKEYRLIVTDIQILSSKDDRASAIALYNTTSKQAYDAASDTLGLLTDRNLASARQASLREDQAYYRSRWWITLTILLAGLSVGGAMIYVQRAISAPLLRLAGRMHTLATHETGIEIEGTERHDEIGEMARAVVVFRNNAIELTASRHGLEQQALMLQEKLAEEQRLMGLQRNFVSMASHEFRTPLTIVDAHAQRLISMKDRLEPGELAERTGRIRSAVLRMTQLIQNLIDSARISDGDVALYFPSGAHGSQRPAARGVSCAAGDGRGGADSGELRHVTFVCHGRHQPPVSGIQQPALQCGEILAWSEFYRGIRCRGGCLRGRIHRGSWHRHSRGRVRTDI